MIDFVVYEGEQYPTFQTLGNAAQFALPFAKHFCRGTGYDIGCGRKEWALPQAIPIDLGFDDSYDANELPDNDVDYIFSSHCLEHVDDWVETMDYWTQTLRTGGVLCLYLPDYSQKYWRPWNNRKHRHVLSPDIIKDYMISRGYENIFASGVDLNNSFMIVGEKG